MTDIGNGGGDSNVENESDENGNSQHPGQRIVF